MTETQSARRLMVLLWLVIGWAVLVVARLLWLQVHEQPRLLLRAQKQQQRLTDETVPRGTIFDRGGQPLAQTLLVRSIAVNPRKIQNPSVIAALLSPLLKLNAKAVESEIREAKKHGRQFLRVKREVTLAEESSVLSLKLEDVNPVHEWKRYYPQGPLAPQLVGTVGMIDANDKAPRGNSGLELSLDDELAGRAGHVRVFTDAHGRVYQKETLLAADQGLDVTLTLDSQLQFIAQQALEAEGRASGADQGALVAMDPKTGEILAMASFPGFDPTRPVLTNTNDKEGRRNVAVSAPFEPGSVFKLITLAAALETTPLRPTTMFGGITGSIVVGDKRIKDHVTSGTLSMADILAFSSNVGAVQIGRQVGAATLYQYIRRFGFGEKTGIELPGEEPGTVHHLRNWTQNSISYVSIGHEVAITSLQMAVAGSVIANGGMRVQPQIILSRRSADGTVFRYSPQLGERVIQPETAIALRAMAEGVILKKGATGSRAALPGYNAGGKTGSAQIYDAKASKAYSQKYNASFLGFAPLADPRIVVAVTFMGTKGHGGEGGMVAAPVFSEVASSALRLLNVPRDYDDPVRLAKFIKGVKVAPENVDDTTEAAGPLAADTPAAAPVVPKSPAIPLPLSAPSVLQGVAQLVPDLRGKALRAVMEECAALGFDVEVAGEGIARAQEPAAGSPLRSGARIKVQFSR